MGALDYLQAVETGSEEVVTQELDIQNLRDHGKIPGALALDERNIDWDSVPDNRKRKDRTDEKAEFICLSKSTPDWLRESYAQQAVSEF